MRWSFFVLVFFGVSPAIGEGVKPLPEMITITRASVSNWQDQQYHYTKSFDGKTETSWGTGGSFLKRNKEWITLYLERPVFVTKIRIAPGLQDSTRPPMLGSFKDNGRPKTISVSFSDDSQQNINLVDFESEDEIGFQERNIKPTRTRWVRLQINSIYRGNTEHPSTQDVGIAEIEVYGFDSLPTED